MTEKLYDRDAYAGEFSASVVRIETDDKGNTAVELDKTLFFPLEGGQNPDTGVLKDTAGNEYRVIDVKIKDDVITHFIEGTVNLKAGDSVEGKIDFMHRFDLMQHHSGEHIFSGITYGKYGYNNVGFHLTEDICTIDVGGPLKEEEILELEYLTNKAISENVPIITGYPSKEEIEKLNYRSKKEVKGPLRIVEVKGYDICACCAPHVKSTGEVGSFHIVKYENYKGGVRLTVKCGLRAVKEYQTYRQILQDTGRALSSAKEDLYSNVMKLKEETCSLKAELNSVKEKALLEKVSAIEHTDKPIVLIEDDMDASLLRNYCNALMDKTESHVFILVKTGTDGTYRFILGGNTVDVAALLSKAKESLTIKGGGRNPQVQGTIEGEENTIIEYFK
jgi:alanyl-tRNA synthetase